MVTPSAQAPGHLGRRGDSCEGPWVPACYVKLGRSGLTGIIQWKLEVTWGIRSPFWIHRLVVIEVPLQQKGLRILEDIKYI
jgi:hypothetical protein